MTPDLSTLAGIKLAEDEPVFAEPWEAQAFAMVVDLHARGAFAWDDWAAMLSAEIHSGAERSYYEHWLAALEKIVAEKDLASEEALQQRRSDWKDAAARTPHGQAIEL